MDKNEVININSSPSRRKRCASASSSSQKLGETDACSRRSSRYSPRKKTLDEEASRRSSETANEQNTSSFLNQTAGDRKWNLTSLGLKIASKEYKIQRHETLFSLMSYNVLAENLAQMHPELYKHGKLSTIRSVKETFHC